MGLSLALVMPLVAGQKLSFYEILGPLGAGAMGEVYSAKDTRLDREVAIKVLPTHFAADEERLHRFEREAKSLASLNHSNVAQIFGVDRVDDTCFLVLELVPGETLEERLDRGALPLDEALDVCRQIAEGLEAAHEAGVIHRDLKPANVRITPDGKVKVLDFGLAKTAGIQREGGSTSDSVHSTEQGRLLGTPIYMAPEQARGKPIDRRIDVWAFGCVLYECLTAKRAFSGETISDVLAAVLEKEPDLRALPAATPPALSELLQRCFRKDPRGRLRDLGDARILLEDLASGRVSTHAAQPSRGAHGILVPLLAATTLAAVSIAIWSWQTGDGRKQPRLEARNALTNSPAWTAGINWSPMGEKITYSEMTERGLDIFVKPAKGGVPRVRVDTPGDDISPRFSPDGQYLAFVSSSMPGSPLCIADAQGDGRLRPLVETGLPILDLTNTGFALGDRPWTLDGRSLLVSLTTASGRVAVHRFYLETGQVEPVTSPGPGQSDYSASLSFDGEHIVFSRQSDGGADLMTMPAGGGQPTELLRDESGSYNPAWRSDNRRVVFSRTTRGGYYDLWEIDTETRELRRITWETRRVWSLSVAQDDRIAYTSAEHDTFLHSVVHGGGGELTQINAYTGDNFGARPSPDGGRIAYHSNRTGNPELWLIDLTSETESQLTDNSVADLYADWSPDGKELVFVSNEKGPFQLFVLDVERLTRRPLTEKPLSVHGSNLINASIFARWSPDPVDQKIAFIVSGDGGFTLWTVRPDGSDLEEVMANVYGFDWYLDSHRGIVTRQREDFSTDLFAVNLATGETQPLWTTPHTELEVAPDGTAVSFCSGPGHMGMNVYVLELEPPVDADGLPTRVGEPVQQTDGEGRWHAHNGGWMSDSQTLVFTRDEDYGDAFELIESD